MSKQESLNKLFEYRDQIQKILAEIDSIIETDFPDEYSVAYQHWLPQIKTALKDNLKYLPRGEYSMDYTLYRIQDKLDNHLDKGVTKYI